MARAEQTGSYYFDTPKLFVLPFWQLSEVLLIDAEKNASLCPPDERVPDQVDAAAMGLPTAKEVSERSSYEVPFGNPFLAIETQKNRIEHGLQAGDEAERPWGDRDLRAALAKMSKQQVRLGLFFESDFIRGVAIEHLRSNPEYQAYILLGLAAEGDADSFDPGIDALQRRLEDSEPLDWSASREMFSLALRCLEDGDDLYKGVLSGMALELLVEMKGYTDNDWSVADYAVSAARLAAALHGLPREASCRDFMEA